MIKAVFIDFDDTLWDTKGNNKQVLKELYTLHNWGRGYSSFEHFGKEYYPTNERQWALYRQGEISKTELMYRRFALVLAPVGDVSERYIEEVNDYFLKRTAVMSGVVEGAIPLLDYLKRHYRVVIVSNGFREVQTSKMKASGIAPYIDDLILSEDAGCSKPNPLIFEYAYKQTALSPQDVVMIGDSWEADIVGAQNAGIPSIWFNPDRLKTPLVGDRSSARSPIYEVVHLSDIPHVLETKLLAQP